MLEALQNQLQDTYQMGCTLDVRDFLITDPGLARVIGQDVLLEHSDETLFIAQDDDGIAMSLYLDANMLERLEISDPLTQLQPESLDDFWKVLEGLSHFSCVNFKAEADREVSLLELELQGEVDKFVSSVQLALQQDAPDLLRKMHNWLFEDVSFHQDLSSEQIDRYKAANDYAARFCHGLQPALLDNEKGALQELRHFYRLPISDKISHINARAW